GPPLPGLSAAGSPAGARRALAPARGAGLLRGDGRRRGGAGFGGEVVLVVAEVAGGLAVADLDHLRREPVEEVAVVGHDDERAAVREQSLQEDLLRGEVEVV